MKQSRLERLWNKGEFTVSAQILLDGRKDVQMVKESGKALSTYVDAFMVPDNQKGRVALSSIAGAAILTQLGPEPVFHLACRDRNRIALQSDLMGAHALGIKQVVCVSGDHPRLGNCSQAKTVYDLDSIQLIALVKALGDSWPFLIGAVENPFADPFEFRVARLGKKIMAGADFVLTQAIFDLDRFQMFMQRVRELGLHKKGKIIASLMPVSSGYRVRELAKEPGMLVPQEVIQAIETGGRAAGMALCLEYLQVLRQTEGISGVHIIFEHWQDVVDIVQMGGLLPRPEGLPS